MNEQDFTDLYFEWIYATVSPTLEESIGSFRKLLMHLHSVQFEYSIPFDGNRATDGIDLRYRFGYEYGIDSRIIASCIDICPCSMLEMMAALAIRCEEDIMSDPDIGNRTSVWFAVMIYSLGLDRMTDENYDEGYVNDILARFFSHTYKKNGEGGLFRLDKPPFHDMRQAEIWWQMNWYIDSIA